jgi:NADPH-dependent glutamate synthase beta subunit-like oxidoreductase/NAD(P)H-flavin reductase
MSRQDLTLRLEGFGYYDLFKPEKLKHLTDIFFNEVRTKNPTLTDQFLEFKKRCGEGYSPIERSRLIVEMAPYLSAFIARIFGVENECKEAKIRTDKELIVLTFKREFFTRRTLKKISEVEARKLDIGTLGAKIRSLWKGFSGFPKDDDELEVAAVVLEILEKEKRLISDRPQEGVEYFRALLAKVRNEAPLKEIIPADDSVESLKKFTSGVLSIFDRWLAACYYQKIGAVKNWITFKQPQKVDFNHLVEFEVSNSPIPNTTCGHEETYRFRDGFDLTDGRYSERQAMNEVDYCVICHEREKDTCSKGILDKDKFRTNPIGFELKGCPLDQKISESHLIKSKGDDIGALAIIAIDNPLCPGTGHRICNDCMKACIYQKQDPVNIPQAETRIVTDVLGLPWGFEIYSLLTRWNPLNIERPYALPYNGKKILIVGQGPAGYTLAHYFLNEGFAVVGIDGLKIEPLPAELTGANGVPFQPVRDVQSIITKLSKRVLLGFGGVSEYGITVRWDKNFLTILYLNLLRRRHFRVYGGIRFAGTLTIEDAWALGFDHISFATGAGKPTFVSIKNNLIRGIRKASDFLMALQLTGAGKKDSIANYQVRLPAVVVGGGLTAIDTATELMAYYPSQVTKIKERYDRLCELHGKDNVDAMFDKEEAGILQTYLFHAKEIEEERERAKREGRPPNFIPLVRKWGGVHIYYRKGMNDSPAYRLNHEEIIKGFEEGIYFVEKMNPVEAVPDEFGALKEILFERMDNSSGKWRSTSEQFRIPARTLMVAAGTVPNVMYEREFPGTIKLDERDEFFKSFAVRRNGTFELAETRDGEVGFFTSYEKNGKYISYYGDNHPVYEGNVVKAMASARKGYKEVVALFADELAKGPGKSASELDADWTALTNKLDNDLKPYVVKVERLTPTIVEVTLHAPQQARKFLPGQFFRLQNYEVDSLKFDNTLLMMEGLALTGAWVDKEKGLLGLIVLEMGSSSNLCRYLKAGQRVVVMGPTGAPTEIPENETALLLGGGLGNAVLFSIAKAFKERGGKVVYFAGYKKKEDFFKREEIEAATDVVVYSVDMGDPIPARRPQDKSFVGNIIQAMLAYANGQLGKIPIPLNDATRVIAIGSDRMMAAVSAARHTSLKPHLNAEHVGIASINSLMQCMMKAVCAQCLQRHVDKETHEEKFVFSCMNQDQCMDEVDFQNLNARLRANSLMEKLSRRWVDHLFEQHGMVGV